MPVSSQVLCSIQSRYSPTDCILSLDRDLYTYLHHHHTTRDALLRCDTPQTQK